MERILMQISYGIFQTDEGWKSSARCLRCRTRFKVDEKRVFIIAGMYRNHINYRYLHRTCFLKLLIPCFKGYIKTTKRYRKDMREIDKNQRVHDILERL